MKLHVAVILLCLLFTLSASSELTKQDLEDIRKIVKEEISHVNKRIDDMKGLIYALIALTGVAIVVPPAVVYAMNRTGKANHTAPPIESNRNVATQPTIAQKKRDRT